jgi:hypothetical protein
MNLDELHETLTSDVDESLETMRREEAAREERFPGYPPYCSDITLEKIEQAVEDHAWWLRDVLSHMFGYVAVDAVPPEKMRHWMRVLAQRVAHMAAGHEAAKAGLQAQQASHNMLIGTLAGIALGSAREKSETHEGTTDASNES